MALFDYLHAKRVDHNLSKWVNFFQKLGELTTGLRWSSVVESFGCVILIKDLLGKVIKTWNLSDIYNYVCQFSAQSDHIWDFSFSWKVASFNFWALLQKIENETQKSVSHFFSGFTRSVHTKIFNEKFDHSFRKTQLKNPKNRNFDPL